MEEQGDLGSFGSMEGFVDSESGLEQWIGRIELRQSDSVGQSDDLDRGRRGRRHAAIVRRR